MKSEQPITITSVRTVTTEGTPVHSASELEPGMQFGRYIIKKLLGEGGMGVVYAAFDPTLNRSIAIKVLRVAGNTGGIDTHSARARMLREAQAMAMCGHPNLVQVFDVGTYSDDVFIAMEFVDGATLREWLLENEKVSWEIVLSKYVDAAKGLAAAHYRHLIHRDFKPENVMVDREGHVRVMDFGLARHTGNENGETTVDTAGALANPLTQTGMIMGTPAYMAPEQFLAEPTDHRTDQFAFCVALFESLYGYRPFHGATMKTLAKNVMRGEITLPPRKHPVDDHVLTAILKGLQTESEDRHDNMSVLVDALTTKPEQSTSWFLYVIVSLIAAAGFFLYWTADSIQKEETNKTPRGAYRMMTTPNKEGVVIPSVTRGKITQEQVKLVVERHQEDIDDCVDTGRKRDAGLTGHVFLKFELVASAEGTKGEVEKVRIVDTDLFDYRTAKCIRAMATDWEFPAPKCQGGSGIKCEAGVSYTIDIPEAPELKPRARKKKRKKK